MQRGIIQLTQEEQSILYRVLQDTPMSRSLLAERLSTTSVPTYSTQEETIELSKEEAESVLDALPIPSHDEPNQIHTVRHKLDAFIQNL